MQTNIKHTWFFEHTPETVWEYLTNPALLEQWLMKNDIEPVPGHKFRFLTQPMPNSGFDGIVYCEVLEATPFRQLSYTWRGGPGDGTINLDTVVTWTLAAIENGTELTLLHSGFTEHNQATHMIMSEGWGKHIKNRLINLINKATNETSAN